MSTDNPTSGTVVPRTYPFSIDSNCADCFRVFSMHFHERENQRCRCHWRRVGNWCEIDDRRTKNSPEDNSQWVWAFDWDDARIDFDPRESRKVDETMTTKNRVIGNPESDRLRLSLRWFHERTMVRKNLQESEIQGNDRRKNDPYWPVLIVEIFSSIGRSDECWLTFFIRFFRSGLLRTGRREDLLSSVSAFEARIRRARVWLSFGAPSRCFLALIFFVDGESAVVVLNGRRWAPAVVFANMIEPIWKKSNRLS